MAVFLGSDRPLNRITQQQVVSRITGEPLNPTGLRKILVNSEELNILKVASGYVKRAIGNDHRNSGFSHWKWWLPVGTWDKQIFWLTKMCSSCFQCCTDNTLLVSTPQLAGRFFCLVPWVYFCGWLVVWNIKWIMTFPSYWECHHPNSYFSEG